MICIIRFFSLNIIICPDISLLSDEEDDIIVKKAYEELNLVVAQTTPSKNVSEKCALFVPSIQVYLEGGTQGKTMQLLFIEIKYEAALHDWNSQVTYM